MKGHFKVIDPGLLITVQDLGRPGFGFLGVSPGGAADRLSFRRGNKILGNPESSPALEITFAGGTFEFLKESIFCLSGADFAATINGHEMPPFRPTHAKRGEILKLGVPETGVRVYLSVQGGFEVPRFLGSASTHLAGGFGGIAGRALKSGDLLAFGSPLPNHFSSSVVPPKSLGQNPLFSFRKTLRVTEGIDFQKLTPAQRELLLAQEYLVTPSTDRLGIRLANKSLEENSVSFWAPWKKEDPISCGVSSGIVQLTPAGQPVILFVDQQTTGGYPQILAVISADGFCLGQLRPGDKIRFQKVTFDEALEALNRQEEALTSLTAKNAVQNE